MSLNFENVEILGYSHQNNFFGENSFNYSAKRNISIRGRLTGNNVNEIISKIRSMQIGSNNFVPVSINGTNFGNGKVVSLEFENGVWVEDARYNATVEVLQQVPLSSIPLSNINTFQFFLIKNFSENFSLDFNADNDIVGGEHTIEIEYDANNSSVNIIDLAKNLAEELLKVLPTDLKEGNYTTRNSNLFKYLYNEDYNLIDGKCGFSKKFSYRNNNNNRPYSINRNISISSSINGITSVEENCEIKAETDQPSLSDNAKAGYDTEIVGSFNRCNKVYNNFKSKLNITTNLNSDHIQKTTQINKNSGAINYKIVYDNDPKKLLKDYIWENTLILDLQNDYTNIVSEEGTITGKKNAEEPFSQKYLKASQGWSSIQSSVADRINSHWNRAKYKASNALKLFKKNVSRLPYQGIINYNISYTDDPSIINVNNIRKLGIAIKDDKVLPPLFKDFIIPNGRYPVRQNLNLKQQGTYEVSITAEIGFENNQRFNGFQYFNTLKNLVPQISKQDKYIESVNYQSDEIEQTANLNITYKYSS